MHFFERVIASLSYHHIYAMIISVLTILYLIWSEVIFMLIGIEQQATTQFNTRVSQLDADQFKSTQNSVETLKQAHYSQLHNYYWIAIALFIATLVLFLLVNYFYLKTKRWHEFFALRIADQSKFSISLQFMFESLILFFSFFVIFILISLLFSKSLVNSLTNMNNDQFVHTLKTLNFSNKQWRIISNLFQQQITSFNNQMLLFNTDPNNEITNFPKVVWHIFGSGTLIVGLTSFVGSWLFNLKIDHTNRKRIKEVSL